jgi:hypothetical protein
MCCLHLQVEELQEAGSYKTLVTSYQTALRDIPEYNNPYSDRYNNLKSDMIFVRRDLRFSQQCCRAFKPSGM